MACGSVTAVADQFRLESASLPAALLDNGKPNAVIEASAVEPIGDGRLCLVAHDKAPALHVVEVATGKLVGSPITSPRFPAQTKTGPKWEGMTHDREGNYYLVGAHSGKTDRERAEKAVLIRFHLTDSAVPAIDDASVITWHIDRSLVSAMKAAGLDDAKIAKRKIEGLAIRDSGLPERGRVLRRELVIGLREPGDKVRAFAADISSPPATDSELELKPAFAFEAEPRENVESQLTSLEYVQALGGFLVITASEDDANAFHGNNLYFVADGETGKARKIATFEVAMKTEGLAVLGVDKNGRKTTVRLLITYDNDPHATKIPSRMQTATLIREAD
jgi:hypothetical protein